MRKGITRYDQSHVREDLLDIIKDISPDRTDFTTIVEREFKRAEKKQRQTALKNVLEGIL